MTVKAEYKRHSTKANRDKAKQVRIDKAISAWEVSERAKGHSVQKPRASK